MAKVQDMTLKCKMLSQELDEVLAELYAPKVSDAPETCEMEDTKSKEQ